MYDHDRINRSDIGSLLRYRKSKGSVAQVLQLLGGENPFSSGTEEQGRRPSPVLEELIEVLVDGLLEESYPPSRDNPPEEKTKEEYEDIFIQLLKDIQDTGQETPTEEERTLEEFKVWNERTKKECDTWMKRIL
jgi:hypothetical protein